MLVAVTDSGKAKEQFLDPQQYVLSLYSVIILVLHIVKSYSLWRVGYINVRLIGKDMFMRALGGVIGVGGEQL